MGTLSGNEYKKQIKETNIWKRIKQIKSKEKKIWNGNISGNTNPVRAWEHAMQVSENELEIDDCG